MIFVLPYYKMKDEERLKEFIGWNEGLGIKTYAVVDKCLQFEHPLLECLVYPKDLPIFSLSKTCNYGIRRCLEEYGPGEVIVKTDADICFPYDTAMEMNKVQGGQAYSPPYHMVNSYEDRHSLTRNRLVADLAIGTVVMTGQDWDKVCGYNENLVGYGCDDGDIWHRIGLKGIARHRGLGCYHIAHRAGTPQQEKHCGGRGRMARTDHHGRANGVNPLRLRENQEILRRSKPWEDRTWGSGS
jgi:hypothetical protein